VSIKWETILPKDIEPQQSTYSISRNSCIKTNI